MDNETTCEHRRLISCLHEEEAPLPMELLLLFNFKLYFHVQYGYFMIMNLNEEKHNKTNKLFNNIVIIIYGIIVL